MSTPTSVNLANIIFFYQKKQIQHARVLCVCPCNAFPSTRDSTVNYYKDSGRWGRCVCCRGKLGVEAAGNCELKGVEREDSCGIIGGAYCVAHCVAHSMLAMVMVMVMEMVMVAGIKLKRKVEVLNKKQNY